MTDFQIIVTLVVFGVVIPMRQSSGASANIVSVGICARDGERVSFVRFMRYGVPVTVAQLTVPAFYVLALFWLFR